MLFELEQTAIIIPKGIPSDFRNNCAQVLKSNKLEGQKALTAIDFIPAFSVIFIFENIVSTTQTRTSIQVAKDLHIEADDFGAFTNHSCSPNSIIVSECDENNMIGKVMLFSIADIAAGDEITFDYATTEYTVTPDLHNSLCKCQSQNCRGFITGFVDLKEKYKNELFTKGFIAKHLIV